MSNTKTEAQRLADGLLAETSKFGTPSIQRGLVNGAIQELRRLDAENKQQRAALERKSEAIQKLWAERDQLRAQVERFPATEPFGYFRAEPMGWTDCAATDEGAIALYERPAAPAVPQGEPVADEWVCKMAKRYAGTIVDRHGHNAFLFTLAELLAFIAALRGKEREYEQPPSHNR